MAWRDVNGGGALPKSLGYEQITGLSSVATLSPPEGTSFALIQAEQEDVRYRADDVDPTATVGMLISAGNEVLYPSTQTDLSQLRFIETVSGAKLNVSYY